MSLLAPTGTVVDEGHDHEHFPHHHDDGLDHHGVGARPAVPLRAVDPRLRVLASVAFAFMVVGMNGMPALVTALLLAGAAAVAARLEPLPALRRMAALDGFMIFVVAFLPFTVPGAPMFTALGLTASHEGLVRACQILLKTNATVLMLLALLGSMEMVTMGHALARLGLPEKLVHLFLFTVRYIEVLGREYRRLRLAMKVRGFKMRCNIHTWRSIGYLFGMLLVRSIDRSERIVAAMRCRGFRGRFHSLSEMAFGPADSAFVVASVAVCAAFFALELG